MFVTTWFFTLIRFCSIFIQIAPLLEFWNTPIEMTLAVRIEYQLEYLVRRKEAVPKQSGRIDKHQLKHRQHI
jgi:hypothetical protein